MIRGPSQLRSVAANAVAVLRCLLQLGNGPGRFDPLLYKKHREGLRLKHFHCHSMLPSSNCEASRWLAHKARCDAAVCTQCIMRNETTTKLHVVVRVFFHTCAQLLSNSA